MFRYTIMRLGIFFGVLLIAWLLGLRNDPALLLLVSAVVSVVLSLILLRRQRDEFSERIAAKIEQRQEDPTHHAARSASSPMPATAARIDTFTTGQDRRDHRQPRRAAVRAAAPGCWRRSILDEAGSGLAGDDLFSWHGGRHPQAHGEGKCRSRSSVVLEGMDSAGRAVRSTLLR